LPKDLCFLAKTEIFVTWKMTHLCFYWAEEPYSNLPNSTARFGRENLQRGIIENRKKEGGKK